MSEVEYLIILSKDLNYIDEGSFRNLNEVINIIKKKFTKSKNKTNRSKPKAKDLKLIALIKIYKNGKRYKIRY